MYWRHLASMSCVHISVLFEIQRFVGKIIRSTCIYVEGSEQPKRVIAGRNILLVTDIPAVYGFCIMGFLFCKHRTECQN